MGPEQQLLSFFEGHRARVLLGDHAKGDTSEEAWTFRGPASLLAAWFSYLRTVCRLAGGTWSRPSFVPIEVMEAIGGPCITTTTLRAIPPGAASPVQVNRYGGSHFVLGEGRGMESRTSADS